MRTVSQILIALLAWGTLSFGAVYPWAYWPLAAGCGAVGVWSIAVTRAWREPRPRQIAFALGGVALALVLQLVPLPYAWFREVTPAADALMGQLQVGWVVHPPAFHPVSIAPASTFTALLLFVALSLLLVGLTRAIPYMPIEWIVGQLTVFGLIVALFGIVQRVAAGPGDILVYGFWRPSGFATPFGPFINRNHFAGWIVLVLPLALAAATVRAQAARGPFRQTWSDWLHWLTSPDASRFVFATVAILIMTVALVLSGSRSGLVSVVVAIGVLGYFASRKRQGRLKRILPALYLLLLVIVAVGWVGFDRTIARFEDSGQEFGERAAAWRDTWQIAHEFPVTGVGLGGYGLAMLVYQTADRHSIYAQAHNEYLQVLAEGGLLVTIPVVIALAVFVVNIKHRFRGGDSPATFWMRAGATAGLSGIAAQSMLDFSLQMPGNAMMFAVLLAIALHRPSAHHANRV